MDLHEWGVLRSPEAALRSERAAQVLTALYAHRDFDLVEIRERHHENQCEDVFIVRCRCDEVPGRNPFCIRYEEPLAIVISSDERALPEVRALRRDFPSTSHQNHVLDGEPTSLCLYDKRPVEVLRRWTAPAFLSRIQWWLSATARGELHAAGQALEQVFFESPHELILPRGFSSSEELAAPIALAGVVQRFRASDLEQRFPAFTFITQRAVSRDAQPSKPPVAQLICITLPAVVHGRIEREPSTLGTLVAQMEARGAPLLAPLSEAIRSYVGQGRTTKEVSKATVLLLSIPIKESEAAPVERVQARAFWLDVDVLTLGLAIGALIRAPEQRDRVFVDHQLPGSQAEAARGFQTWKSLALSPLTVLEALTPKLAQQVSGVTQSGPVGVLAGAGALGSTMLQLWRRSGWGSWTVIDPDHMRPHNVPRHWSRHVGWPKAEAVALSDLELWQDEEPAIAHVVDDAAALDNPRVLAPLRAATLIVDATTTVDVPRRLAAHDALARVASCFLTPSGEDAVLLAEDVQRTHRIDAVEAQYYRALLSEPWGENHFGALPPAFRSGASCRDLSHVMPYSKIVAHAATLAESIQELPATAGARIWRRDRSGAVAVFTIDVAPVRYECINDITVVWDEEILRKLRAYRAAALPAETGGVLVGYHDFNEHKIYVVDAISAPADSIGTPEDFKRGIEGLAPRIEDMNQRSAGQVTYLGEWHSHPVGASARPSVDDIRQLLFLGALLQHDGLPALMLIVAEDHQQWLMAR